MTEVSMTLEPEKVHVVMGAAGEYSDRREWPIKAYFDLAAAQAHVDGATAYMLQNLPGGYMDWQEREKFSQNNPWDRGGEIECYSGADYFLYSVEIEGAAAERTRADTLERERDALRDALMVAVRRANDCIRGCPTVDGGVGWLAAGCDCAKEASDAVESFTVRATPSPGEPT